MAYDYITQHTSPNQDTRPAGSKITSITIHHWGNDGQKFQSVVNYLCRTGGNTSAHYVVEAGKVACIVNPGRRAWHAGTNTGNATSIGIECRPEATDADYATAAELIRELRKTYGDLPLKRHSDWKATACPGRWDLARLDALARGTTTAATTTPATTAGGKTNADGSTTIAVDGLRGPATIARWQEVMGTPIDGVISKPSTLIRADQGFLNSVVPAESIRDLTGKTALDKGGIEGKATITVRQFWLFNQYGQAVLGRPPTIADFDGIAGKNTTRLHQHALNKATARTGRY